MLRQLLTLMDLFILANYPVSYKVVKVLQAYLRDTFGTCLNVKTNDRMRMRNTRRHCVVLACIVAWFGHFARMKFVFFAWKEVSFGFRKMAWQWMSTFAVNGNYCSLEYCFIADDENNLLSWNVGWWYTAEVQKPWFLLPYSIMSRRMLSALQSVTPAQLNVTVRLCHPVKIS